MCGPLALLFLAVPAVEIYLIIEVGGLLGPWATLAVIAVTALIGASLAKSQGMAVLNNLQASIAQGKGTGTAIVEGVLVLAAGVTLLAPGFITDAIGLALLVPPIRHAIASRLAGKMSVVASGPLGVNPADLHRRASGARDDDTDPPPPGVIDV